MSGGGASYGRWCGLRAFSCFACDVIHSKAIRRRRGIIGSEHKVVKLSELELVRTSRGKLSNNSSSILRTRAPS